MRALVVFCHPVPDSYGAAIREAVLRGLARAGHAADLIDLYADGFQPALTEEERRNYHTPGLNRLPVADHLDRVKAADALIFVAPTWWYGPPAMLKGWLDRVLVPFETFGMPEPYRPLQRRLTNIRLIAAVTTLGSPWLWWRWIGQPGRRILIDGIGGIVHPKAQRLWMALHNMDSVSLTRRQHFLSRVEENFSRLEIKNRS